MIFHVILEQAEDNWIVAEVGPGTTRLRIAGQRRKGCLG